MKVSRAANPSSKGHWRVSDHPMRVVNTTKGWIIVFDPPKAKADDYDFQRHCCTWIKSADFSVYSTRRLALDALNMALLSESAPWSG